MKFEDKEYDHKRCKRVFQMRWLQEFPWLTVDAKRGIMKCKICCMWPTISIPSFVFKYMYNYSKNKAIVITILYFLYSFKLHEWILLDFLPSCYILDNQVILPDKRFLPPTYPGTSFVKNICQTLIHANTCTFLYTVSAMRVCFC